MIRAFASGTGGIGLDPGPRDTKNVKMVPKNTLVAWRSSFIFSKHWHLFYQKNNFRDGNTIIEVVVGDGQFSSIKDSISIYGHWFYH